PKDSLAFLEEAERILDANGDQTSLGRVNADIKLAQYWRSSGRDIGRSRSYATKAVEICRRHHPTRQLFIYALHHAAISEYFAHHTAASVELSQEAVDLHRRLGAPEIDLIKPLAQLAEEESSLSRFADAERDYKEGVALSLRIYGEDHVESIWTRVRYGGFLRMLGRLRESELLQRKVAETAVRVLSVEESFHVPWTRFELAGTLAELGKIEEAESLYSKAIVTTEKTRPNTYRHASMLESAAPLQLLLGRYELADHMFAQGQSIFE